MTEMKRCKRCGEEKPATTEYFYSTKANTAQPLMARCRPCHLAVQKEQRDQPAAKARASETAKRKYQRYKNDAEAMARKKEQWAKAEEKRRNDPEQKRLRAEASRERYYKNWEKTRRRRNELARRRYKEDEQFRLDAKKRYEKRYAEKPFAFREACDKRRAARKQAGGGHTSSELLHLKKHQKDLCAYCQKPLPESGWHADHIIPLSRGGSDNIENIAIACRSCNCSKHTKLLHEWMPERFSPPDAQATD